MEKASRDSSDTHLQKKQRTEDKTRSAIVDFDVLDCPVCFETLTIPIYQCNNGHLACSSCCPKLSNKCPVCALPIGNNRCRAMENVLESVFVPCSNVKFGCAKRLSYGKESTHENECIFSPCFCPLQDCNFKGSYFDLFNHFNSGLTHKNPRAFTAFSCICNFQVQMNINDDKILIKIERGQRLVFVVQCFKEAYGVYVNVSCIAPSSPNIGEFSCVHFYSVDGQSIIYRTSKVKKVLQVSFQAPPENSMLIPHGLLRGEMLEMTLQIKKLY